MKKIVTTIAIILCVVLLGGIATLVVTEKFLKPSVKKGTQTDTTVTKNTDNPAKDNTSEGEKQDADKSAYKSSLSETIETDYVLFLGLRDYKEPSYDSNVTVVPSSIIENHPAPFYRTLFINFKEQENPIFETKDLYFLRNGELWNAGVVRCLYEKKWLEDLIYVAPLTQEPLLQKADYNRMRVSNGTDTTIINYLGKNLMSVAFATEGVDPGLMHNWAYGKLAMLPTENMQNLYEYNVLISEVLGEEGKKIMLEESNKAYLRSKNNDRLMEYSDEANWGMIHKNGEVSLIGRLDYNSEVGKGYFEDYTIPIDAEKLLENTKAYPSWETVKQKVSNAVDAVSSPDQKALVVITNTELLIFKIMDETNWKEVFRYPLKAGEQIVMCEWEQENEEIKSLLEQFTAAEWYKRLLHNY